MDDLHNESIADELEGDPPSWDLLSLKPEQVDERLHRAVDTLPDTYRVVLLLWAVEGLKYEQIAEVLDVALGTVLSRLYRARMTLSKQLGELAAEKGIRIEADFRF
jgi:RNA polymerase sigma factor (sigma-70 family)